MRDSEKRNWQFLLLAACGLLAGTANASEDIADGESRSIRSEFAFGFNSWAALADLRPVADGEFDEIGYSLSGAVHWLFRYRAESELLLGLDFGLLPNESSITYVNQDLLARALYIVPSLKWKLGTKKRLSLDAGLGYYLVDIAGIASEYPLYIETEFWEDSGLGGFIGASWNFDSATSNNGTLISLKAHFLDLGTVRDQDPFLPARLGPDAGKLSGPVYQLQLGYRWE